MDLGETLEEAMKTLERWAADFPKQWRQQGEGKARGNERKAVRLLTAGAGGVLPGIDIADSAAMLDAMDAVDDAYRRD